MMFSSLLMVTMLTKVVQSGRHCTGDCQKEAVNSIMAKVMPEKARQLNEIMARNIALEESSDEHKFTELGAMSCVNGFINNYYECDNIDLVGFLPFTSLRGEHSDAHLSNDVWGWEDRETKREYVIAGQWDQTVIVEITKGYLNPIAAMVRTPSKWSDIKVYEDYMYIGTEGDRTDSANAGGIQIYNLKKLRQFENQTKEDPIVTIEPDFVYDEVGSSHNVVINEETGFLYIVGSKTCNGGLHIVNIREQSNPSFVNCFSADDYTHDAQCVVYRGEDERYYGREICFAYNEDTITIIDVENKDDVKIISRNGYPEAQYTHQGWLTEDHRFLLMNDELDEYNAAVGNQQTHTYVWDVRDLENPFHSRSYLANYESIDHNLYVKDEKAFCSNYGAGLRVLNVTDLDNLDNPIKEIAFIDIHPEPDIETKPTATQPGVQFTGVWSNYPYFKSGMIAVNSIDRGLFIVKLNNTNLN